MGEENREENKSKIKSKKRGKEVGIKGANGWVTRGGDEEEGGGKMREVRFG